MFSTSGLCALDYSFGLFGAIRQVRSEKMAELYALEMLGRKIGLITGPKARGWGAGWAICGKQGVEVKSQSELSLW